MHYYSSLGQYAPSLSRPRNCVKWVTQLGRGYPRILHINYPWAIYMYHDIWLVLAQPPNWWRVDMTSVLRGIRTVASAIGRPCGLSAPRPSSCGKLLALHLPKRPPGASGSQISRSGQTVQWVPALGHDRAMRYRILTLVRGVKRCGNSPPRRWRRYIW